MPRNKKTPEKTVYEKPNKMAAAEKKAKTRADVITDAKRRAIEREIKEQARTSNLNTFAEANAAKESGRILYTTFIGVQKMDAKGTNSIAPYEVMALGQYGNLKVMMPFSEIHKDNPINISLYHNFRTLNQDGEVDENSVFDVKALNDYNRRQTSIIERLYGYTTPFMVMEIAPGENIEDSVILGSRKRALHHFTRANFLPDSNGETRIKEGDVVDCAIFAVGSGSVWANIGGVDTRISLANLTYRFVGIRYDTKEEYKLSRYFHINQMIKVVIKNIEQTPNGPQLLVTAKPTELLAQKSGKGASVAVGMQMQAIIVRVAEGKDESSVSLTCWIEAYDRTAYVPAYVPTGRIKPERGRTALLTINGMYDSGMLIAWCRAVI